MPDIEFHIGEMRAHHARLEGLATRAEESDTRGQELSQGIGFELYGMLCTPVLGPMLQVAEASNTGALSALKDVMAGRRDAFQETTDAYEGTEDLAKELAEKAADVVED